MRLIGAVRVGADAFIDQYAAQNGGEQRPCSSCKAPLWISPSMQKIDGEAICFQCLEQAADSSPILGVLTPEAARELKAMRREAARRN